MASNGDRSDGSSDNSTWRLDDGDKPRPASATGGTDEHESVLDRFIDSFLRAIDVEMDAMRERMGPFEVPLAQGHLLDRGNGGKGPLLYRFGFLQSNDKLVLDAECTLVAGLQEHLVVITSIDGGDLVLRSEREEIDLSADAFSLVIYPWFLYQRLKVVLQSLSHDPDSYYTANALALFGKAPPRELPADPFAPQSQFADLNSSQLSALEMCCNRTPAFVWGPPGTGKTTTLGHIVTALLHRGQRILVTSTTNAAVDQALAKLAGLEAAAEALERGEIVRVGQTQAETFGAGLQQVVERLDTRTGERLTRVKQRQRELQNQLELCERALELLDGAAQPRQLGLFENDLPPSELSHRLLDEIFTSPGRVRAILGLAPEQQRALVARRQHRLTSCLELYRERATQHHRERRHREAGVVDGARVILATMTNVYISALLQPQRFDVVIVEEASMAILPTLFYCASLSRNRLIMVGDPRQLPPIVQSPQPYVYRAMGRSIFEVTEEKLTKNTRAILPVHIYGQPADMDPIMALAKKHSLTVIEDAAQAHGALYNDRQVGSIGDAGAFSFFGNKIITTGEGGMITTDDAELAHKARLLRNHGMSETRTYWHDHLGFNYRMTNLQAAIGVAQLERIDEILKTKIALAQRYKNLLKDVPGVIQPPDVPGIKNVYWMYSIRLDEKFGMTAEALQKVLRENEIDSRPFFIPVHELPMYEEKGGYPVSTELSKTGLSLPSSPKLTHEDIDRITSVVRKATG